MVKKLAIICCLLFSSCGTVEPVLQTTCEYGTDLCTYIDQLCGLIKTPVVTYQAAQAKQRDIDSLLVKIESTVDLLKMSIEQERFGQ